LRGSADATRHHPARDDGSAHRRRPLSPALGRACRPRLEGDGGEPLRHRCDGRSAALGPGGVCRRRGHHGRGDRGFYAGALELASAHDTVIVGGDTSASPSGWTINITLLGEATAPLLRSTARPGDTLAVTGSLGRSAAGLAVLEREHAPGGVEAAHLAAVTAAHLRPHPRVREGMWLAAAGGVTAMMDLSDGVGIDLARLVDESHGGAVIDVERLPLDEATRAVAAALGADPLAWATGGGEDYELLVACDPAALPRLQRGLADAFRIPLTPIGEVTAGATGVRWRSRGREVTVARGFEHFAARPAASGAGA
jgi:thiamine-monophosphate kinase